MNITKAKDIKPENLTVLIYGAPGMGKTNLLGKQEGRMLIIYADKGTSITVQCDIHGVEEAYRNNRAYRR